MYNYEFGRVAHLAGKERANHPVKVVRQEVELELGRKTRKNYPRSCKLRSIALANF